MRSSEILYSDTQQKILTTALSLFSKNGFKATTTRQIAKEADINESTLFKNFKNKAKVFMAVQQTESLLFQKAILEVFNHDFANSQEFINHSVEQIYQIFLQHSSYVTIMFRELDNDALNIGEDSILEYVTNTLSLQLSTITGVKSVQYNPIMFMLVSSLMILVVNQTNNHALTDDLQAPIHIEQISDLTYQMIQNIK